MTEFTPKPKSKRGFASMDPERRKQVAAMGGAAVPGAKRAFSVDKELAKQAGKKGSEVSIGVRQENARLRKEV